jgi:hypothetical protein
LETINIDNVKAIEMAFDIIHSRSFNKYLENGFITVDTHSGIKSMVNLLKSGTIKLIIDGNKE